MMISNTARGMSSSQHINKSWNVGQNGQRDYYQSCKAAKLDVKQATNAQDMAHIDFIVDGKTVDVKGMKDTHKLGQILLEVKNVQGKDGWCSANSCEFVAFDFGAFFLHAKTTDLVKLVKKKCDLAKKVYKAKDALYKAYTRSGRLDLMTVVSLTDVIKDCEHWYLPKQIWNFPMEQVI